VAAFVAELAVFAPKAKGSVASDLSVSAYEAEAAARGFRMNVRANTSGYRDKDAAAALEQEAEGLLEKTVSACRAVREATGG
jgi:formiminotetrahydrofolate cyclodeaminase